MVIFHSKIVIFHSKMVIFHSKMVIFHSKMVFFHSKMVIFHSKIVIFHSIMVISHSNMLVHQRVNDIKNNEKNDNRFPMATRSFSALSTMACNVPSWLHSCATNLRAPLRRRPGNRWAMNKIPWWIDCEKGDLILPGLLGIMMGPIGLGNKTTQGEQTQSEHIWVCLKMLGIFPMK